MEAQHFCLYCDPLDDFRNKLDSMLQSLMATMTEKDLAEGCVTAKVKVTRRIVVCGEKEKPETMIQIEPSVGMKIGASGSAKCDKSPGLLLRYTGEGIPLIGENQISMNEYMAANKLEEGG